MPRKKKELTSPSFNGKPKATAWDSVERDTRWNQPTIVRPGLRRRLRLAVKRRCLTPLSFGEDHSQDAMHSIRQWRPTFPRRWPFAFWQIGARQCI
jgi:hypothetical protein